MAFLKDYAGRYILLQESNTVDEKQLEDALSIARKRGVPDNIMEQCQAASAKDTEKGRVVAILELGKTILLNTAQERRKWEEHTFVPANDLKKYKYVTEIKNVHRITRPWHWKGGQTLFYAWAQVDALPSALKHGMLQSSAKDWA